MKDQKNSLCGVLLLLLWSRGPTPRIILQRPEAPGQPPGLVKAQQKQCDMLARNLAYFVLGLSLIGPATVDQF